MRHIWTFVAFTVLASGCNGCCQTTETADGGSTGAEGTSGGSTASAGSSGGHGSTGGPGSSTGHAPSTSGGSGSTGATSAATSSGGNASATTGGASSTGSSSGSAGTTGSGTGTTGSASTSSGSNGGSTGGPADAGTEVTLAYEVVPGGGVQNMYADEELLAHDGKGDLLAGLLAYNTASSCHSNQLEVAFYTAATGTWSAPAFPPYPAYQAFGQPGYDNCPAPTGAHGFAIALSDDGDALVTWRGYVPFDGGAYQIALAVEADHYDHTSGTWTGPVVVQSPSTVDGYETEVATALDPTGDGWILSVPGLSCNDGTANTQLGVTAVPYTPDGGFGPAQLIGSGTACTPCDPAGTSSIIEVEGVNPYLTALADGGFVAAWSELEDVTTDCGRGSATGLFAGARTLADGGWYSFAAPAFTLPDDQPSAPIPVSMAAGGADALVAWGVAFDAGPQAGASPVVQIVVTGLTPSDPAWEAQQVVVAPGSFLQDVSTALSPDGTGAVSWLGLPPSGQVDGDEMVASIAGPAQSFAVGQPLDVTAACPLATPYVDNPGAGTVAAGPDGTFAVVWMQPSGTSPTQTPGVGFLLGSAYAPDAGWGPCSWASTSMDYGTASYPIIAWTGSEWGTIYLDGNEAVFTPWLP
ncbi:MAG TPA: hypothetical protein VMB50_02995 [Myxococcales bacterium]|nr:hypothetical protein [Myxococcales bacterium]